jgi:hypothetical protein
VSWKAVAMAAALAGSAAASSELGRVPVGRWCVTRGRIAAMPDGRGRITEPKVRAVVPRSDGNAAKLRFVYHGPSAGNAPLASGELRRQIGLKLRAENGCNLLYVMWRIAPQSRIVVSLKHNPGQRIHRECGARGYRNLKPRAGVQPPPLVPGTAHVLRAALAGRDLRVWADGKLAWEGELGPEALALTGPAGLRSDNGRFDVELHVRAGDATTPCGAPGDED